MKRERIGGILWKENLLLHELVILHLGLKLQSRFKERGSTIAVLHYPHKNAIAVVLIETIDKLPLKIIRNGNEFPVMAMNCADINYTYQHLQDKGVELGEIHTLGEGEAKYFYFKDDQGNLLEAAWSKWDPVDDIKEDY